MGDKWYSMRVIKPIEIIEINVGREFDLHNVTKYKKWVKPYMIYSYKYLQANTPFYDSELELQKISDSKYKYVSVTKDISNDSIISVLITESNDLNDIISQKSESRIGQWEEILKLSSAIVDYELIDIDITNNSQIDIFIKNPYNKELQYFLIYNKLDYKEFADNFKWNLVNNTFSITTKGGGLKYYSKIPFKVNQDISVPDNCIAFSLHGFVSQIYNDKRSAISLYVDDKYIKKIEPLTVIPKTGYNYMTPCAIFNSGIQVFDGNKIKLDIQWFSDVTPANVHSIGNIAFFTKDDANTNYKNHFKGKLLVVKK